MDNLVASIMAQVGSSNATSTERMDIIDNLVSLDRELRFKDDQIKRFQSLQQAFDKLSNDFEALRRGNLRSYKIFPTIGTDFPNKLMLIKALREVHDMGLADAKKCIDEGSVILTPEKRELLHKILMGRPTLNASVSVGAPIEAPKPDDIPF